MTIKTLLKVVGVALALWVVLAAVTVSVAKSSNTPQPRLSAIVHSAVAQAAANVGGKAAAGTVSCTGPVEKYVYVCKIRATTAEGVKTCLNYFIAWKGGIKIDVSYAVWGCNQKRVKLPPIPYQVKGPAA